MDFTIVIPCYNSEKFIAKTIYEIEKQDYPKDKFELIVVNDGSSDRTELVLSKMKNIFSNIKVISNKNQGVSAARNIGINNSSGEYILFVDADDKINRQALKSLRSCIDKYGNKTDIFLYSLKYDFGWFRRRKHHWRDKYLETGLYNIDECIAVLTNVNYCVSSVLAKKELFDTDLSIHEDEEFALRILLYKRNFCFCSRAEYIYCKNIDNSITNRMLKEDDRIIEALKFYKSLMDRYLYNGVLDKYVQRVIFNDFTWRMKLGCLMREGCEEDYHIVKTIMMKLDDDIIYSNTNIDSSIKKKFLFIKKC